MPNLTRDNLKWESYDGRKILVKDLEVRHLVNILNHVKETNEAGPANPYPPRVVCILEAEGDLRIMAGWAKDIGIPRRNDDGTWELINQTADEKAIEDARTALHKAELAKSKGKRLSPLELQHKLKDLQLRTVIG